MESPYSLSGKQILVTGASSGIGKAIAIICSQLGGIVTITGRNLQRLQETLSMMHGEGHQMFIADLTDVDDRERLVNQLTVMDGIVQNAGVGSRVLCKNILQIDLDYIFKPNIEAPILLQTSLLKKKKINKDASIVFIASRAANAPSIGNAIYSASKGAIISYAKCLALELASRQIRVNCICPAMVWTDLILQDGISKEDMVDAQKKYPLKRYGKPEDIAKLAVYLLSDASCWMTGSCIDITGGGEGTLTL